MQKRSKSFVYFVFCALSLALWLLVAVPVQAKPYAFGHIYIPRIAFESTVGECALIDGQHDTARLGDGVCHLAGTATIDHDWARIVLAGHSPGAFGDLVYVQVGDQLLLWSDRAVEVYRVIQVAVVAASDVSWIMPTESETLTLITCAGDQRLIVHAERETQ